MKVYHRDGSIADVDSVDAREYVATGQYFYSAEALAKKVEEEGASESTEAEAVAPAKLTKSELKTALDLAGTEYPKNATVAELTALLPSE